MLKSGLYSGRVRHRRFGTPSHAFDFRLFMMYLDLEELPTLFDGRLLWSSGRPAPLWFRRADYLGPSDSPLDSAVRNCAEELTGRRPAGPIRMLTHLRTFGFLMNPVTFYYCFAPEGDQVETILAEITNTPWQERFTYAIAGDPADPATDSLHLFGKTFHVSPFMPMEQEYRWRFSTPGSRLGVHMENWREGECVFDATLTLDREEISGSSLRRALFRYPLMTMKVGAGIYGHAARLWWKGATFHPHPSTTSSTPSDSSAVPPKPRIGAPARSRSS